MEKVYIDKQIFSYLYKSETTFQKDLFQNIIESKDNYLYLFSHAHILDLQNDKSDIKYKELEFIKSIVDTNYLVFEHSKRRVGYYLVTPIEAYNEYNQNDIDTDFSLTRIFEELKSVPASKILTEQVNELENKLKEIKLDFPYIGKIPEDLKIILGEVFKDTDNSVSLYDWVNYINNLSKDFTNNKSTYKQYRNILFNNLNKGKFSVEYDELNFSEKLKDSDLKKSFIDFVKENVSNIHSENPTEYDFFVNAYCSLDLLGLSMESSKTVKFRNIMADANHSFYAAHCDYLVSDDIGLLKKSKALYHLLNIDTKTYSSDEFKNFISLSNLGYKTEKSTFIHLLKNDLDNGIVLRKYKSIRFNRESIKIKSANKYFAHFNTIEDFTENGRRYICLYRSFFNYSNIQFYKDYESITNKSIDLFGIDDSENGYFDWGKETLEIKEKKWKGRFWSLDGATVLIEYNEGLEKICLCIAFDVGVNKDININELLS